MEHNPNNIDYNVQMKQVLTQVFGLPSFRGHQKDIILNTICGNNALVLMPTGGGKSLCYQIPSMIRNGCGIVISPLIALMKDQVDSLLQNGVSAGYLSSSLDFDQIKETEAQYLHGELDLLYITPEKALSPYFQNFLNRGQVSLFAVDEAHCISRWGHDFRPEYVQLHQLINQYPDIPVIALTATADELTRNDIISKLHLEKGKVFCTGFDRPNIHYAIEPKKEAKKQFLKFYNQNHQGDAGIVYCISRRKVESTAKWLQDQGINALAYHAGMDIHQRRFNQETFIQEEGVVMVATIAFGMGIDKPNVRFVAHLDLPKGIENYYQETGRAGRDGLPSNAWMCYGLGDIISQKKMIESGQAQGDFKLLEIRKLDAILGLCETPHCRRKVLLNYFGDELNHKCNNCDNCLTIVETWDGTTQAQMALSTIFRSGQRFGVNHLIDILLGNETLKVLDFSHQNLSVFGIGKELTEKQWRSLFRQLIAFGYVRVNHEQFGSLELASKSKNILNGQEKVFFRKDKEPTRPTPLSKKKKKKKKTKTNKAKSKPTSPYMDHQPVDWEEDCLGRLKRLRLKLSKQRRVPPYAIFHDRTLLEMIEHRPQNAEELSELYGVGQTKLKKYGKMFLQVLHKSNVD